GWESRYNARRGLSRPVDSADIPSVGPIALQSADDPQRPVASNWLRSSRGGPRPPNPRVALEEGPTLPTTFSFGRRAPRASFGLLLSLVASAVAVPPSDTLLPKSTKGYISVAHPKEFDDRWKKTQLGQMFDDEVMKAFVEDFKKQVQEDLGSVERKLGLTYDDLKGVTGGEMSLSLLERKGEAALAITIDVTGHQKQAEAMIASVEKRFAGRKGT